MVSKAKAVGGSAAGIDYIMGSVDETEKIAR